jgi:hypothetical protein
LGAAIAVAPDAKPTKPPPTCRDKIALEAALIHAGSLATTTSTLNAPSSVL